MRASPDGDGLRTGGGNAGLSAASRRIVRVPGDFALLGDRGFRILSCRPGKPDRPHGLDGTNLKTMQEVITLLVFVGPIHREAAVAREAANIGMSLA